MCYLEFWTSQFLLCLKVNNQYRKKRKRQGSFWKCPVGCQMSILMECLLFSWIYSSSALHHESFHEYHIVLFQITLTLSPGSLSFNWYLNYMHLKNFYVFSCFSFYILVFVIVTNLISPSLKPFWHAILSEWTSVDLSILNSSSVSSHYLWTTNYQFIC